MTVQLAATFNNQKYSDFSIIDDTGRTLYLHRLVVGTSSYFDRLFTSNPDLKVLQVSTLDFVHLSNLLECLYEGRRHSVVFSKQRMEMAILYDLPCSMDPSILRDRWRRNFDVKEVMQVAKLDPGCVRIISETLICNWDKIPLHALTPALCYYLDDEVIADLAFKYDRLDLLDPSHNVYALSQFHNKIKGMNLSQATRYFKRDHAQALTSASRLVWLSFGPYHVLNPSMLLIKTLAPLTGFRIYKGISIPDDVTDKVIFGPDYCGDVADVAYVSEVGLEPVKITHNGEPVTRMVGGNTYTLSWSGKIGGNRQIYLLQNL